MASTETDAPKSTTSSTKQLDLAFAMDTTASMGPYIRQAQQSIRSIVEEIVSKESADVNMALVEYRDHPPQENTFVTRVHDFTSSIKEMKGWLDQSKAGGGGDVPEAVADALHQILKLSWRENATKMCVFISDAPPHGIGGGLRDGFPQGCPDGLDCMQITNDLATKCITLYTVGCEPSIDRWKEFFHALAHMTGGQYVPLKKADLLAQVILGGAIEELSLQQTMEDVQQELKQQMDSIGSDGLDEDAIIEKIHENMTKKGAKSKVLNLNSAPLPVASDYAEKLSNLTSMSQVRTEWKEPAVARTTYTDRMLRSDGPSRPSRHVYSDSIESDSLPSRHYYAGGDVESDSIDMSEMSSGRPSPATVDSYVVSDFVPVEKSQIARMVRKASRAQGMREKFKKKT